MVFRSKSLRPSVRTGLDITGCAGNFLQQVSLNHSFTLIISCKLFVLLKKTGYFIDNSGIVLIMEARL